MSQNRFTQQVLRSVVSNPASRACHKWGKVLKISDYIVKFLEVQGIEYIFGYQGGMITHLADSISKSSKIKFIQCYHEQSAAFAAEGYARATGKFGVCITTSGPGATNTITSIGNAFFDSIPVLYITGQVNTTEYKYDKRIRQKGFQETDICSIVSPVVKKTFFLDRPQQVVPVFEEAVGIMLTGRKGPVHIDLPMDIQRSELPIGNVDVRPYNEFPRLNICKRDVDEAVAILKKAEHPLVICGGGVSDSTLKESVVEFINRTSIPYVVSLMGKGTVSEESDLFVGMIGSYGNRAANLVLSESDVVLCVGSRLDLRQTGNRNSLLLKKIKFIRIDVDGCEALDNPVPNQLSIHADITTFFASNEVKSLGRMISDDWINRVKYLKTRMSQQEDIKRHVANKLPYTVIEAISARAMPDAIVVADIGQNQMWSAQAIMCGVERRFLTSGGMAPMGYAIPAAVGVAFANPDKQVICICGDGGFHMAIQSLLLISQYGLKVAVVIMNNQALGMITQFQSLYFDGNLVGTTKQGGYVVPDIEHLASAYSLPYRQVRNANEITSESLFGPAIVEVLIEGSTVVVPKLEYNKNLDDMTPAF